MKKAILFTLLTCAFSCSVLTSLKDRHYYNEEKDATIIVKMKTDVNKYSHDSIINQQNYLLSQISNNITHHYTISGRYSHIFSGFVLNLPSIYVEEIRQLDLVDEIDFNNFLFYEESIADGFDYEISGATSTTASSQTMEKPSNTNDGAGTFVAILDNSFYIRTTFGRQSYHHVFSPLENNDVYVTQSSLKAKIDAASGFHGKYDRSHTTYYNNKVPFYYDYGGDNASRIVPDYDVYAEGQSHGSHVASIAAGNAKDEYEGIAPRSQLALMKVFTTYMSGNTYASGAYPNAVLNALEDCLVLEVDAINMSFGSNLNDFNDTEIVQDTIRQLSKKGIFVNAAAGNDGKGQWGNSAYSYWQSDMVESGILSSYANNLSAMTVASGQPDFQFYGAALKIDDHNVQYSDQVTNYTSSSGAVTYDPERYLADLSTSYHRDEFDFVYLPGIGAIEEYQGIDVSGKILITNRGEITFKEKVDNAINHGAIAVGIIDNVYDTDFNIRMSFRGDDETYTPSVPVIFILNRDKSVFESSTSLKMKLIKNTDLDNPNARTMSSFSSDGMRYDLAIKPEITAPGSNIKGAVLGAVDKYESMSGTSMAAPNYTGAVALLIGEHLSDANYRQTINARLMSTAHPMFDSTLSPNYTSVRRQGAGLINLEGALTSSVYLDGLDEEDHQIGKAKIELFNHEDIAKGDINLSFMAINEKEETISYEAKTFVLAPQLGELDEKDYPELAHKKLQTINEQLVETFVDQIVVNAGSNKVSISHSLNSEKLALLDEQFPSGCVLEGFTILTAINEPQLSIPFLGYYGDLEAVSPVEPFDFEKDENKVYNSDLINAYAMHSYNKEPVDFASHILSGYWNNVDTANLGNVFKKNTTNIVDLEDDNGRKLNVLGFNPYSNKYDASKIYISNNEYSNTIVIQQSVLRSVKDNTVRIVDKKTGEEIVSTHLTDSLDGSSSLYKSHMDMSMFASGYIAHRAYCVIPLYKEVDGAKQSFVEGEYELLFSYQLSAGSTFEKKYDLVICNDTPILRSIEKVTVNEEDYYRFNYIGDELATVNIYGKSYPINQQEDEDVFFALVPVSDLKQNKADSFEAINFINNKEITLINTENNNFIVLSNPSILNGYTLSYEVIGEATNDQVFSFSISNAQDEIIIEGLSTYYILLPAGLDAESLSVYEIKPNGEETSLAFTYEKGILSFESVYQEFRFSSGLGLGHNLIDEHGSNSSAPNNSEEAKYLRTITINRPYKLEYNVGEELDLTGLVVTAIYSDGTTAVLKENEYRVGEVDMSTAGQKSVNIYYSGIIATFTINVNSPAKKTGCRGSMMTSLPLLFVAFALVAASFTRKKKERD